MYQQPTTNQPTAHQQLTDNPSTYNQPTNNLPTTNQTTNSTPTTYMYNLPTTHQPTNSTPTTYKQPTCTNLPITQQQLHTEHYNMFALSILATVIQVLFYYSS